MKKAQKVRLGIFILISLALLLIIIAFFTTRNLFEQKETYYVAYEDVSVGGLEVGSPVKYLGIDVGSIANIHIDPEDVNRVIVELSLQEGTPIKQDAVANIVAMGITGLRTIEIKGGTEEADFLEPEGYISAGTSLAEDITGKAEVIYFRLEQVLSNLQEFTRPENIKTFTKTAEDISLFADQAGQTVLNVDEMIEENRDEVRRTIQTINEFSDDLDKTSDEMFQAVARFNQIMQGDTLGQVLANFRDLSVTLKETNLNELIEQLAETTDQTQRLLLRVGEDVERGSEVLTDNLMILQNTLENLHETSRKVSANPSVLIRRPTMEGSADKMLDQE